MSRIYRSRAAQIIEKWWIRVRNRKVFEVLKRAVCTAVRNSLNQTRDVTELCTQEHSVTNEVLRKLCPLEAELLRDPTIKAKVRFRLMYTLLVPKGQHNHRLFLSCLVAAVKIKNGS